MDVYSNLAKNKDVAKYYLAILECDTTILQVLENLPVKVSVPLFQNYGLLGRTFSAIYAFANEIDTKEDNERFLAIAEGISQKNLSDAIEKKFTTSFKRMIPSSMTMKFGWETG